MGWAWEFWMPSGNQRRRLAKALYAECIPAGQESAMLLIWSEAHPYVMQHHQRMHWAVEVRDQLVLRQLLSAAER